MSVRRRQHAYSESEANTVTNLLEISRETGGWMRRRADSPPRPVNPPTHPALTTFGPQTLAEFVRERSTLTGASSAVHASSSKDKGKGKAKANEDASRTSNTAAPEAGRDTLFDSCFLDARNDLQEASMPGSFPASVVGDVSDLQDLLARDAQARGSLQPARLSFGRNAIDQLHGRRDSQDPFLEPQTQQSPQQSPRKRRSPRKATMNKQALADTPLDQDNDDEEFPDPPIVSPRPSRRGPPSTRNQSQRIQSQGSSAGGGLSYATRRRQPSDPRPRPANATSAAATQSAIVGVSRPSFPLPNQTTPMTLASALNRRTGTKRTWMLPTSTSFSFHQFADNDDSDVELDTGSMAAVAAPRAIVPFNYNAIVPTRTPVVAIRDRPQPAASAVGSKRARVRFAGRGDPDDDDDDDSDDDGSTNGDDHDYDWGYGHSPNAKDLSISNDNPRRTWAGRGLPVPPGAPPSCPLPADAAYQMPDLPDDIWITIAEYLSLLDIHALRLVSRDVSNHMPAIQFRSLVAPFGPALQSMAAQPHTSVVAKYAPDIKKFGISFEYDPAALAFASPKTSLKTEEAWYGSYKWPAQQYNRYEDLKELEDLVDNNTPMLKDVFAQLRSTNELGLAVDSGHGWLNGPDISDMALLQLRQTKGTRVFGQAFGNEPAWEAYGRDEYFKWAQKNTINELLRHLGARNGTPDVLRMLDVANSFEIRERSSFKIARLQADYNDDAHTGGRALNANNAGAAGPGPGPGPAPPQLPPFQLNPQGQPQQPQAPIQVPAMPGAFPGAAPWGLPPQPGAAAANANPVNAPPQVQAQPAQGHFGQFQIQLPGAAQGMNQAQLQAQQQQAAMAAAAQMQLAALQQLALNVQPNMPPPTPTLFGAPMQPVDRPRGRNANATRKSKAKQKERNVPLQWPLIFNGYNLAAETGGCLPAVLAKVAVPARHAFYPGSLTEAQMQRLMETLWGQRTFLSSWTNAIISNSGNLTYVHTLTISKLSSGLLPSLGQPKFWDALPCLRRLRLLVSPDWRREHREQDVYIQRSTLVSPLDAVGKFAQFLQSHICRLERLSHATFGWVGGGEHATGICARNQNLLPAPIISTPRNWISDHDFAFKGDEGEMLKFEHIRDLTFENCWFSPYMLETFMKKSRDTSLHTVTLNSVSLLARHSSSLQTQLLTTVGDNLACRHAVDEWQHEQLPGSATWTEVLDAITPGKTLLEHEYDAGMIDRDLEPVPRRSFRGHLQRIVLKSCGYAEIQGIKTEQFNQHNLVTQPRGATDVGLRARESALRGRIYLPGTRSAGFNTTYGTSANEDINGTGRVDVGSLMLSINEASSSPAWQGLGVLTQCVHPIEKRVLEQAWGLRFGWGDDLERYAAVEDGQLEGGTGRFSGIIIGDGFDDEEDA